MLMMPNLCDFQLNLHRSLLIKALDLDIIYHILNPGGVL
jgi:hypothetical protein